MAGFIVLRCFPEVFCDFSGFERGGEGVGPADASGRQGAADAQVEGLDGGARGVVGGGETVVGGGPEAEGAVEGGIAQDEEAGGAGVFGLADGFADQRAADAAALVVGVDGDGAQGEEAALRRVRLRVA